LKGRKKEVLYCLWGKEHKGINLSKRGGNETYNWIVEWDIIVIGNYRDINRDIV
jgi:hypothetical protein